jgi:hypothetical protein
MKKINPIIERAEKMQKAEMAARSMANESPTGRIKALVFATCTLVVSLLPAGGAALNIL